MSQETNVTYKNIDGITLKINFQNSTIDELTELKNLLVSGKFKSVKVEAESFFDILEDYIPILSFFGDGFEIGITRKNLVLQFLEGKELASKISYKSDSEASPEKILSRENLAKVENDFNYIIGIVLGKLKLNLNNLITEFTFTYSKEGKLQNDLAMHLKNESKVLFGVVSDLHFRGFRFSTTEKLFGVENVEGQFNLGERIEETTNKTYVAGMCTFKFKAQGPANIFEIMNEGIDRLNSLINKLGGGINVD